MDVLGDDFFRIGSARLVNVGEHDRHRQNPDPEFPRLDRSNGEVDEPVDGRVEDDALVKGALVDVKDA